MPDPDASEAPAEIDWEAFYRRYREPGYVAGFEIVNKLGGGAFGLVYKARKQSIGKDYAIKFLKVDDAAVRDAVLGELQTVRLFAQIDHPNLVSIEDQGQVDGIPYILMGYAGEETLARRLAAGRLRRDEALRLFTQICRGVQALHERMLVHFDLKPANVYLKDDVARVGDYGLSKLVTASRRSLSFGRGTTYYMAPEVLDRKGDHRSDIYSLGVLLYEMLTGEVPFRGETEWEVLKQHANDEATFPDDLEAGDVALLRRCLAKDPDERVQSIAEILDHLASPEHRLAAPAPAAAATAAPRDQRRPGPPPPRRRHHAPAVAAAVVICGWLMWMLVQPHPAPEPQPPRIAAASARRVAAVVEAPGPPPPPEFAEAAFGVALDDAIAALQRLRATEARLPAIGEKALAALTETLRGIGPARDVDHRPDISSLAFRRILMALGRSLRDAPDDKEAQAWRSTLQAVLDAFRGEAGDAAARRE